MFPSGWPGRGLLLLRLLAGVLLIHDAVTELLRQSQLHSVARPSITASAGMLLLVGLWTPAAGVLAVIAELWTAATSSDNLQNCFILAALGAALAMLGPGVLSVDARLFGRKRIEIPDR